MLWLRRLTGLIFLSLLLIPLLLPLLQLTQLSTMAGVWKESSRLWIAGRNSIILMAGCIAIALPFGISLALLLYRTDLPLRRLFRGIILISLFIPAPLLVAGWQWTELISRSGTPQIIAAISLFGIAGAPWVALLVGHALTGVERELEEDALTMIPAHQVLWHVGLRRCRTAILASILWLALQVLTTIAIPDLLQVRTFAEEIHLQFSRPDAGAPALTIAQITARAMAVALPALILFGIAVALAARAWTAHHAQGQGQAEPLLFGWKAHPMLVLLSAIAILLMVIPIGGLVWKAGQQLPGSSWSPGLLVQRFGSALTANGLSLLRHLAIALLVGLITASMALIVSWLALENLWLRGTALMLVVLGWTLPAPVVGLALKQVIHGLMDLTGWAWLANALYYGPSPAPVIWAQILRLFPLAMALLWPVAWLIPRELMESARIDGAGPVQELQWVIWPWMRRTWLAGALSVAALSLGEIGASKMVSTPGAQTFAEDLLAQLHYNLGPTIAAQCLVLLSLVVLLISPWGKQR